MLIAGVRETHWIMSVLGVEEVAQTERTWFAAVRRVTAPRVASSIGVAGLDSKAGGLLIESTRFNVG